MKDKEGGRAGEGVQVLDREPEARAGQAPGPGPRQPAGVRIAKLIAVADSGDALIALPAGGGAALAPARSLALLRKEDVGRAVALMFENGRSDRPLVVGVIEEEPSATGRDAADDEMGGGPSLGIDGHRLVLTAIREIVLRCGKGSVTITREGKILIRGTHIVTRASGVNRIKGGSVQIN